MYMDLIIQICDMDDQQMYMDYLIISDLICTGQESSLRRRKSNAAEEGDAAEAGLLCSWNPQEYFDDTLMYSDVF